MVGVDAWGSQADGEAHGGGCLAALLVLKILLDLQIVEAFARLCVAVG